MPVLATLEEEFAPKSLAVVTICLGASDSQTRDALRKANVNLLALVDKGEEMVMVYHVRATPTTYLIGSDGVILMSTVGYSKDKEATLRREIQRLLGN